MKWDAETRSEKFVDCVCRSGGDGMLTRWQRIKRRLRCGLFGHRGRFQIAGTFWRCNCGKYVVDRPGDPMRRVR